jgi:hypothetical protein
MVVVGVEGMDSSSLCLLDHGADVNMMDEVSTATRGVAVMVEMVVCGGEG